LRSYGTWRFTDNTIVDRNELDREFARVRAQNFAVDREETVPDGICFGVPIRGESNEVTAAVSVSIPKTRLRDGKIEKAIVATLAAVAEKISTDLRHVAGSRSAPAAETPAPEKRKPASRHPRRRA
jgi:DNA-binding IclR family transcriptional regulator